MRRSFAAVAVATLLYVCCGAPGGPRQRLAMLPVPVAVAAVDPLLLQAPELFLQSITALQDLVEVESLSRVLDGTIHASEGLQSALAEQALALADIARTKSTQTLIDIGHTIIPENYFEPGNRGFEITQQVQELQAKVSKADYWAQVASAAGAQVTQALQSAAQEQLVSPAQNLLASVRQETITALGKVALAQSEVAQFAKEQVASSPLPTLPDRLAEASASAQSYVSMQAANTASATTATLGSAGDALAKTATSAANVVFGKATSVGNLLASRVGGAASGLREIDVLGAAQQATRSLASVRVVDPAELASYIASTGGAALTGVSAQGAQIAGGVGSIIQDAGQVVQGTTLQLASVSQRLASTIQGTGSGVTEGLDALTAVVSQEVKGQAEQLAGEGRKVYELVKSNVPTQLPELFASAVRSKLAEAVDAVRPQLLQQLDDTRAQVTSVKSQLDDINLAAVTSKAQRAVYDFYFPPGYFEEGGRGFEIGQQAEALKSQLTPEQLLTLLRVKTAAAEEYVRATAHVQVVSPLQSYWALAQTQVQQSVDTAASYAQETIDGVSGDAERAVKGFVQTLHSQGVTIPVFVSELPRNTAIQDASGASHALGKVLMHTSESFATLGRGMEWCTGMMRDACAEGFCLAREAADKTREGAKDLSDTLRQSMCLEQETQRLMDRATYTAQLFADRISQAHRHLRSTDLVVSSLGRATRLLRSFAQA